MSLPQLVKLDVTQKGSTPVNHLLGCCSRAHVEKWLVVMAMLMTRKVMVMGQTRPASKPHNMCEARGPGRERGETGPRLTLLDPGRVVAGAQSRKKRWEDAAPTSSPPHRSHRRIITTRLTLEEDKAPSRYRLLSTPTPTPALAPSRTGFIRKALNPTFVYR